MPRPTTYVKFGTTRSFTMYSIISICLTAVISIVMIIVRNGSNPAMTESETIHTFGQLGKSDM
jgi:ABC-type lipoprotein release transport system permease subunit